MKRALVGWAAVIAALAVPGAASAVPVSSVFAGETASGAAIPCATLSDQVRSCHGSDGGGGASDLRLKSFDGSPLEVYVILPPAPATGADGRYPLIVQSHGWGGSAGGPDSDQYLGPTADAWAKLGFAVLQLTARGFGDSCGSAASRLVAPLACMNEYIHLDDERYEVRDIQYAAGLLVDQGIVDSSRIGATGPSYGGGVSLELATLKDRMMLPNGTLAHWTSPGGTPMRLAAAAPVVPWTDLTYSLMPNGRTLDYQITSPAADLSPIGVSKQSFTSGLYTLGTVAGHYATPHTNPQADVTSWFAAINAGEPYDTNPTTRQIARTIAQYHSAYYLLDGAFDTSRESPSPLLVANGFTDDLFPVDEAIRYYNLERSTYPSDPIALFDWDGGHMRGQNKPADSALLTSRIASFLEHYVAGTGATPRLGATALTETCPKTAPSGGPFSAPTWAALHPGEVFFSWAPVKTISSAAGNPAIAKAIDPISSPGACATVSAKDQGKGVATYRLPAATGNGYTLLGAATVIADLQVPSGFFPQVAARLWDVEEATHTQTLVARGIYRLDPAKPDGLQVFQLHPGAWHFAPGHVPKLELLGQDAPYARPSNGKFRIDVSDLELRLPVHDRPGAQGAPPVVMRPRPTVASQPHACLGYPTSQILSAAFSRPGAHFRGPILHLEISGIASETRCPQFSAKTRRLQRIVHVFLIFSRPAAHHHCRFLTSRGKLTAPRSCSKPVELKAHGTASWSFKLRSIPPGEFTVRSDAVDKLGHHQRPPFKSIGIG